LSDRFNQTARMRNRITQDEAVETIAGFGSGALVRTSNGRYRFQGGTREDRAAARKWIATFAPTIVLEDA
jgi:hypothetical protein